MGCCESSQDSRDEYYSQRIPQYSQPTVRPVQRSQEDEPKYGKFKCNTCKRHWDSRFCWPGRYQICKGCHCKVFPYTHRELDEDDFDEEAGESKGHQMDLCQKCQELGQLCIKEINLPRKIRYNRNK